MPKFRIIRIICTALAIAAFAANLPAFAQSSGNPFARPSAAPPAPATPAPAPAVPAPPVPALPPKLLEPDAEELRNTFADLTLVATVDSKAVLKAGEVVYYLNNGDKFTYDGNEVRVKVVGNKVQLFSDKGEKSKEVFSAEVGNGVVTTRSSEGTKRDSKPAYKPAEKPPVPPATATDTKSGNNSNTKKSTTK